MFLTVHATSGVVIAQATGNPWLGFIAAFISHFILDVIPHGDQSLVKEKFVFSPSELKLFRILGVSDMFCMSALMALLYFTGQFTNPFLAFVGIAGAILPDYINALYIFFKVKWLKWYFSFHYDLHYALNGFTVNMPVGIVIQTVTLAIFLTLLIAY